MNIKNFCSQWNINNKDINHRLGEIFVIFLRISEKGHVGRSYKEPHTK